MNYNKELIKSINDIIKKNESRKNEYCDTELNRYCDILAYKDIKLLLERIMQGNCNLDAD